METLILGETDEERAKSSHLSFLPAEREKPKLICGICGSRDNFFWGQADDQIFLICANCQTPSAYLDIEALEHAGD